MTAPDDGWRDDPWPPVEKLPKPVVLHRGDHVAVGSLVVQRAYGDRPARVATGVIREFTATSVIVDLDRPVKGETWCSASYSELRVIP